MRNNSGRKLSGKNIRHGHRGSESGRLFRGIAVEGAALVLSLANIINLGGICGIGGGNQTLEPLMKLMEMM